MSFKNKINLATRVFKSIFLNQMPNYSIIYIDGRCNMHCDVCCYAAMDARNSSNIMPSDWGNVFKRAKSLLHLTITGGEPPSEPGSPGTTCVLPSHLSRNNLKRT